LKDRGAVTFRVEQLVSHTLSRKTVSYILRDIYVNVSYIVFSAVIIISCSSNI